MSTEAKATTSSTGTATDSEASIPTNQKFWFATDRGRTILKRSKAFRKLSDWAFRICDDDNTGHINRDELYAGIILVHLQLAKYCGTAACYPPSRSTINALFINCDKDKTNTIDQVEFRNIMIICCAQITSRLIVYFIIIIALVPIAAKRLGRIMLQFDDMIGWQWSTNKSYDQYFLWFDMIIEKIIYYTLFALVVPIFFNWIDRSSEKVAADAEIDQDEDHSDTNKQSSSTTNKKTN